MNDVITSLPNRQRRDVPSVTFPVHDVEQGRLETPEISLSASLQTCARSGEDFVPEVLAVSDADGRYLELPAQNGLLAAVHLAFSQHLPLTLSPDMIWLAILQGFARHVRVNATQLEGQLMRQPGKHLIVIRQTDGAWNWEEIFAKFASALDQHVDERLHNLAADFSTTGVVERAASHVALMDVFSPYVQYIFRCVCGIPSITLTGSETDWTHLREKLAALRGFEADEWIGEVDEIVARFIDAARGEVDREWWQQIYKVKPRYGGEDLEGWMGSFFPYLRDHRGNFSRRLKGEVFTTDLVPPGISEVTVKLEMPSGHETLRVIAGFVGVQNLGSDGVMPKIGWAVSRSHFMEQLVETIASYAGFGTRAPRLDLWMESEDQQRGFELSPAQLPVDLQLFYKASDGADLFGRGVLHSLETLLRTSPVSFHDHLGRWEDGSLILAGGAITRARWTGQHWEHQTLGKTFSEFLARLLTAGGRAFWNEEGFVEPELSPAWKKFQPPRPQVTRVVDLLQALRRQNSRLRSMKTVRHDVFLIRSALGEIPDSLPGALRPFYADCDGVMQVNGFEVWSSRQVTAVPGGQERWFEVGTAPGYRILFDVAADRGLAVVRLADGKMNLVARSFEGLFKQAAAVPCGLFWEVPDSQEWLDPRRYALWPDESVISEEAGGSEAFVDT